MVAGYNVTALSLSLSLRFFLFGKFLVWESESEVIRVGIGFGYYWTHTTRHCISQKTRQVRRLIKKYDELFPTEECDCISCPEEPKDSYLSLRLFTRCSQVYRAALCS